MENVTQPFVSVTDASRPPQPETANNLQTSRPQTDLETIFSDIYNYPWDQDSEFQAGLSSILGRAERPASNDTTDQDNALLLQAQCFYFVRKHSLPAPVDVTAYKSWLNARPEVQQADTNHTQHPSGHPSNRSSPNPTALPPPQNNGASPPAQPTPPYPTSFATIVDLITRNQPIPGIQEIPDTILDANLSAPDKTPRRRKPWEEDNQTDREGRPEGRSVAADSGTGTWMQAIERVSGQT